MARKAKKKERLKKTKNEDTGQEQQGGKENEGLPPDDDVQAAVQPPTQMDQLSTLAPSDEDKQPFPAAEDLPPLPDSPNASPSETSQSFATADLVFTDAETFAHLPQLQVADGHQGAEEVTNNEVDEELGNIPDSDDKTESHHGHVLTEDETHILPDAEPLMTENQNGIATASPQLDDTIDDEANASSPPHDAHSTQRDNPETNDPQPTGEAHGEIERHLASHQDSAPSASPQPPMSAVTPPNGAHQFNDASKEVTNSRTAPSTHGNHTEPFPITTSNPLPSPAVSEPMQKSMSSPDKHSHGPSPPTLPHSQHGFARPLPCYGFNTGTHPKGQIIHTVSTENPVNPTSGSSPGGGYQSSSSPNNPSYHIPSRISFLQRRDQGSHGSQYRSMSEGRSSQRQSAPYDFSENNTPGPSDADPANLLGRIQAAMPDIHRLVTSYREKQSQLTSREAEYQHMRAEHDKALMHKEFYIESLEDQMRKTASESAEERSNLKRNVAELRDEIEDLKAKLTDAVAGLCETQKAYDNQTEARVELLHQVEKLRKDIQDKEDAYARELGQQRDNEKEALAKQKEELEGQFQEIKDQDERLAVEQLKSRERELKAEQDSLKTDWDCERRNLEEAKDNMAADYQHQLDAKQSEIDVTYRDLNRKHEELEKKQTDVEMKDSELDAKQLEIDTKKGDLDAKQSELEAKQTELNTKQEEINNIQDELNSKKTELESMSAQLEESQTELADKCAKAESKEAELESIKDQLSATHAELASNRAELDAKQSELAANQAEVNEMKQKHAEELGALRNTLEEQANAAREVGELVSDLTTEYKQKEQTWQKTREELEAQLATKDAELEQALEEKESLFREDKERDERVKGIIEDMRQTHDKLTEDRKRLKKTISGLGHPTATNVKGDKFFVECFEEISRLIINAAKDFSDYPPGKIPQDILCKIPTNLPRFVDDTEASRELRAAYIQHLISSSLDRRMFQPFLFTLGRGYDKADAFLHSLSADIGRKSIRRETVWRQQTLKAAYTASNAKQSINVAAAVIVDEIVGNVRHFTKPSRLEAVVREVRQIVKLAAETWRLARVEREMITATMTFSEEIWESSESWNEFEYGYTESVTRSEDADGEAQGDRQPLLCTLPRFVREACHEDLLAEDDNEKAAPCVYFPGVVLYADSPSVVRRLAELDAEE